MKVNLSLIYDRAIFKQLRCKRCKTSSAIATCLAGRLVCLSLNEASPKNRRHVSRLSWGNVLINEVPYGVHSDVLSKAGMLR